VRYPWAGIVIALISNALGETGRWAGQWVAEESILETKVEANDGDSSRFEDRVFELEDASLFAEPPRDFLVDVHELLSPGAAADRLEFLRLHAEDSKIDLYVYVFGEGTNIPADTGMERLFDKKHVAVVLYFLDEPQRAGLYLSPQLVDAISESEQRRTLQSSMMQAAGQIDSEAQLEAFLVQISIRLYWMERMMEDGVQKKPPSFNMVQPRALKSEKAERFPPLILGGLRWIVGGIFLVSTLPMIWWLRRLRARYRFPEFMVEPRLGGRHAAGVGAVISYLSPNVPPAAQRDQVLDDWQRR